MLANNIMADGRFRQVNIEEILNTLVERGSFCCAVVASREGLLLATEGQADTVLIAAVAASMKDLAERAHQGLTEIVTRDAKGNKIINRYFKVGDDMLLLSVSLSANQTYRRLTNQAIHQIRQVWAA